LAVEAPGELLMYVPGEELRCAFGSGRAGFF